ncbi:DegT/DnrJ/EryC1/StrS family aminotransferase [Candidatus Pelagibacter sp.]|nr:DegT/DnrJ/EryC1/StrS family aminotransferase [Candidatus Pelagibacter sp.]
MKKIPIFKLKFEKKFQNKFNSLSKKIFNSKALSEGRFVSKFEKNFSRFVNSKYSIAVTNGTSALEIAFRTINIKNQEVLVPTNTFFATIIAIIKAGGIPVLCDNKVDSPDISIKEISKKITKKTKAICVVHVGGIISDEIENLVKLCNKKKLFLIEDAAHAHGSYLNKKLHAGTIGDIGCFSFYPTKVMTTGEGGMITTNNKKLFKQMNSYKNFGRGSNPNLIDFYGFNYKISEFTAILGILELKRIQKRIQKRKELVMRYFKNLKNNNKYSVIVQSKGRSSYYKCIIKTKIRSEIIEKFCKRNGIQLTGKVWNIPIHKQNVFKKYLNKDKFLNAEKFSEYHICPPNYPELTLGDIDYVCSILNKI